MIEPSKFTAPDFLQNFHDLELQYINEIEEMITSQLFNTGHLVFGEESSDILEFSGKTNYKIRIKRPHKNVWSIPIQLLKESIRNVLRSGKLPEDKISKIEKKKVTKTNYDLPIQLLLQSVPQNEFLARTFVGNYVTHKVYGEGIIKRITENENVEVEFKDKEVLLKPNFCMLKTSN